MEFKVKNMSESHWTLAENIFYEVIDTLEALVNIFQGCYFAECG